LVSNRMTSIDACGARQGLCALAVLPEFRDCAPPRTIGAVRRPVSTRPIAGTRPAASIVTDLDLAQGMLTKEQAERIMLIDLGAT
jgi:hypothetical protein